MPDLSLEASANYWHEFMDPMIYRVVVFLESVEDWTLDGNPELEQAIAALGDAFDALESVDLNTLNHQEKIIRLVANVKSGRGLRILQAMDVAQPGSASKILVYAETNNAFHDDPSSIFLKRNIAFERLRLLSRIFSETRLKLVARALEGDE